MSRSKRLGLIVGGPMFLIGVIFVFTYSPDTTPAPRPPIVRPAKTQVVEAGGQLIKRSFSGVVQAQEQVDLSFRVSGPLVELPVRAGDEVKAGDLIAQIDPRDFRTALASITSSLESARPQLEKMRAGERAEVITMLEKQMAAARLSYENAKVEEERYRKLWEGGTESKSTYDRRRLQMDIKKEELDAVEEDLKRGRKGARQEDLDAQEARIRGLEQQQAAALDALADTSLKAPFAGRIAKRYVENFQDVRAKSPVVSVQDITRDKVVADIPENLMILLRKEYIDRLTVAFDVPGNPEFDVTLEEVDVEADSRTQPYAITVLLDATGEYSILPGMSASLRLYLNDKFETAGAGVPVPADALFVDPGGQSFLWVVDESSLTVSKKPVKMGEFGFATILTLIIVPVLYAIFFKIPSEPGAE